jgi:hypothetical protein
MRMHSSILAADFEPLEETMTLWLTLALYLAARRSTSPFLHRFSAGGRAMAKAPARVKFRTVEREEVAPEQVDQGMRAWATFLGQALQRRVVERVKVSAQCQEPVRER